MSKYTTELRYICEHSAGLDESVGYNSIDTVLDGCRDKIFDFDFPIFDEEYRPTLENKILKHYYTREIGCETVGLWKHFLCTRLNEIMPYYNQLYKSELIKFNPMYDTDLTTDYQKVDNGSNEKTSDFTEQGAFTENDATVGSDTFSTKGRTNESGIGKDTSTSHSETDDDNTHTPTNKNDHWEYFSDTPEGQLQGVQQMNYLTTALHTTDDSTGSEVTDDRHTENDTNNVSENITNKVGNTDNEGVNNSTSKTDKDGTNNKSGNANSNELIKNVEDYLHHVVGKSGGVSYSKLLEEYRKTFLNIDMMIINDLRDLFMNLW